MTARSRGGWKCRPPAGRATIARGCSARSPRPISTGWPPASPSTACKYGPIVADLERTKGIYSWATVSLKEGKNREVKRVMESLGLKVARLIRVQFGPFQLGQLEAGPVEEIPAQLWREQLGIGRKHRKPAKD